MIRRPTARLFVLLLGVLSPAAVGCGNDGKSAAAEQLTVEDLTYQLLPSGARIVSGTLVNPSERHFPSAQIQVSLFDENNVAVGNLSVTVRDVEAGGRVEFREPVNSDADVRSARVRSVLVL